MKRLIGRGMAIVCWGGLFFAWSGFSGLGARAQESTWSKVDTLTSGAFEDLNPVVAHNTMEGYMQEGAPMYVVFERHTPEESQIASIRFDPSIGRWDSVVRTISAAPAPQEQVQPDYAEIADYSSWPSVHTMRVATWLKKDSDLWQIYYSTLRDSETVWSTPKLLVEDTVDNTLAKIRPFRDSLFVLTWKRSGTLGALLLSPSGITTRVDTLLRAASDLLEYDIVNRWDWLELVWTSGPVDTPVVMHQRISLYQIIDTAPPDTVLTGEPVSDPRAYVGFASRPVFVESHVSGSTDIWGFNWYDEYVSLTEDPTAENQNASAFTVPLITKPGASPLRQFPGLQACAYEKYRGADSMLVFLSYGETDTLRSVGHNRNPVVGSRVLQLAGWWPTVVSIVWESNRTGHSHIYGRWVRLYLGDVQDDQEVPLSFTLEQNFPNPFNPSTTIRYSLPHWSHVTVTVFTVLGERVATLVDGEEEAGPHEVRFSPSAVGAGGLASGVYFYRLETPGFVQTRKLLLLH